ncbi:MAG: phosphatase PAP2 family protein [Rhizomicrobium sp.]
MAARIRMCDAAAPLFGLLLCGPACAETNQGLANIGTGVAIVLPVAAAGISYWKDDWRGIGQLALTTGATVGTALLLKQFVKEERPDYSDDRSFPSDTAALAFAPASYLWERYGWEYGAPAYGAAIFSGYTRVASDEHHWLDVAASAGIAWGYTFLFTSRWHYAYNINSSIQVTSHAAFASLSYRW